MKAVRLFDRRNLAGILVMAWISIAAASSAETPEDEPQTEAPTLFDIACPDGLVLEPYEVTREDWSALVQGVLWLREDLAGELEGANNSSDIDADLDGSPPIEMEDYLWNVLHKLASRIDLNNDGTDEIYISTFPLRCTNGNFACPIWFLDSDSPRRILLEGHGQCVTLGPPNEDGWHDIWIISLSSDGYDGSVDQVTREYRTTDGHYQLIGERRTPLRDALVD